MLTQRGNLNGIFSKSVLNVIELDAGEWQREIGCISLACYRRNAHFRWKRGKKAVWKASRNICTLTTSSQKASDADASNILVRAQEN